MASEYHDKLCQRASAFLRRNGFAVALDDRFLARLATKEQPDAMGFRNGVSCLIEVKVSRSDFKKDSSKPFRTNGQGVGDWRFYLAPKGLISVTELPAGWGLLEVTENNRIETTHGWPPNTAWCSDKPFTTNLHAERDYLYAALRQVKKTGTLPGW